jgi:RNA polymerase primary sigma factor
MNDTLEHTDAIAANDHSAFRLYVREVGQTKLLTPKEERELARRIRKGDAEAREQMIKANLRLVVKIARDYEGLGVPLLDLISEGNIGLMKGVDRFDPDKGAKFSTYGAFWIKQAIRRALDNQAKTIRLPSHVVERLGILQRAATKLAEELGREPSDEELAAETGLSERKVQQYRRASAPPASLDAPIGDETDSNRVADIVADEKAALPSQELSASMDLDLMNELLGSLNEREVNILRRRYGLDGEQEKTLEEIGLDYGLTRERIRQIENAALHKLRKRMAKRDAMHFAA